jgi:hypothetical protein
LLYTWHQSGHFAFMIARKYPRVFQFTSNYEQYGWAWSWSYEINNQFINHECIGIEFSAPDNWEWDTEEPTEGQIILANTLMSDLDKVHSGLTRYSSNQWVAWLPWAHPDTSTWSDGTHSSLGIDRSVGRGKSITEMNISELQAYEQELVSLIEIRNEMVKVWAIGSGDRHKARAESRLTQTRQEKQKAPSSK